MSEGPAGDIDQWDRFEQSTRHWENIQMEEVVWTDLDSNVLDVIEMVVDGTDAFGDDLEAVNKLDAETVELVYRGDWEGEEDTAYSKRLTSRDVKEVRNSIQGLFGDHWRVYRKEISLYEHDPEKYREHPQRLLVKRADHQRFSYFEEHEATYKEALHGRPDGVPETARTWGDIVEQYPGAPDSDPGLDIYVYESHTGTKHLVKGTDLREGYVFEPVDCHCGYEVDRETVAAGEQIEHYATVLHRLNDRDVLGDLRNSDPETILNPPEDYEGDDPGLCGRCWQRYAKTRRNSHSGKVRGHEAPTDRYGRLLNWDHDRWGPEVTDDE